MGHHPPAEESVIPRILAAVAEKEGVDESQLETPLYDVVDPDALDTLFRDTSGTVTFEYLSYTITVDHDNAVEVVPADTQQEN